MSEITSEQYASLGKVLFEVFQLSDQQGLDCPIINIEDCEECPFGKACDLIIELEKYNQAFSQGDDRPQKETASYPQMDTQAIIWCECKEFCRMLDEHDQLEAAEAELDNLQGKVEERVRGLVEALEDIQRSGTGREEDGTISMTVEAIKAQSALVRYRNV